MSVPSEYALVSAWRKISFIGGVLSIVLGLVLLLWPHLTALALTALIGVWLLVLGGARLADGVARRAVGHALTGAVYAIAGIVVLTNLDASLHFVAVMLGVVWICAGLSEAVAGVSRVGGTWVRTAAILTGVINITLGLIIILIPGIDVLALSEFAAAWLILLGAVQLYASYQARKTEREIRTGPS